MALKLAKDTSFVNFPKIIKVVAIEIPFQQEYSNVLSKHTKKLFEEAIAITKDLLETFGAI
jgi:hypothetical protein